MFKRLFTKYVVTSMVIILASYLFLGCLLLVFTQRYVIAEKQNTMTSNLQITSGLAQALYTDQITKNMQPLYYSSIDLLAKASDAVITIVDATGTAVYSTDVNILRYNAHIGQGIMDKITNSEQYREVGTLDSLYNSRRFSMGVPIQNLQGQSVGAIFISTSAGGYSELITALMKIFFVASLVALMLTFLLMFMLTRQLVKPLNEMSRAAKSYAKGNFDTRISVTGNDEISELAGAFNHMADSLAHLEGMRKSFLQNVSHDLRTPMTSISGFIDGMIDGTIPQEQYGYYLTIVSDETKRLARLTRTLLDVSELESDNEKFNLEDYDICESIRRVLINFENRVVSKDMKLKINMPEEEVRVYADIDATHRVIYNLIDNAVKFSYQSGMLTISIDKTDKLARISVRNTGIGISAADLPFVFDRFFKSDKSRGLDSKGIGLGLYITKTIIEKQGGTITVNSTENEYCEFVFTLPLSAQNEKGGN
ncbi:MAG: ATP-binding protein [Bacillota bacterium]|nr:ATP-binding protein [Bacillota bacterium]